MPNFQTRGAGTLALLLLVSVADVAAAEDRLTKFLDQLLTVDSVRMESRAVIHLQMDSTPRSGFGTFDYSERGDRFRIRCETGKSLGLLADMEWGYDGNESHLWLLGSNTLSENESVNIAAPTALPNPLFLAVSFLFSPETCAGCKPSVDEAIHARTFISETFDQEDSVTLTSSRFSREYRIELQLLEGMWVPERIAWFDEELDADATLDLGDYTRLGSVLWPMQVSLRSEARTSGATARIDFLITSLEFDVDLPDSAFTVSGDANTVYP